MKQQNLQRQLEDQAHIAVGSLSVTTTESFDSGHTVSAIDRTKKTVLTVTINRISPHLDHRLKRWLIEATVDASENSESESANNKIYFLVHSPVRSFQTLEILGKMFVIEFGHTFDIDVLYSGEISISPFK